MWYAAIVTVEKYGVYTCMMYATRYTRTRKQRQATLADDQDMMHQERHRPILYK